MKNRLSLSIWLVISFLMVFMSSCQKENYDVSNTTTEEIEPEVNYTGDDNVFSFTLTKITPNNSNTSGGNAVENNITKEVLNNGEIKWKLFSSITDGITVTNEITFITPNTDAGIYPIEELHFLKTDDTGAILDEHTWTNADMPNATITVSGLADTPGIVSGNTQDIEIIISPTLKYYYSATFSEVPIN